MTKENTKDDKKSDKDDKKSDDEEEVKSKIPPKEDKEIDKEDKVEPTPLPPPKTQQQIEEETAFRDLDDEVKNTLMVTERVKWLFLHLSIFHRFSKRHFCVVHQ